jgi:hypothetical protein
MVVFLERALGNRVADKKGFDTGEQNFGFLVIEDLANPVFPCRVDFLSP